MGLIPAVTMAMPFISMLIGPTGFLVVLLIFCVELVLYFAVLVVIMTLMIVLFVAAIITIIFIIITLTMMFMNYMGPIEVFFNILSFATNIWTLPAKFLLCIIILFFKFMFINPNRSM